MGKTAVPVGPLNAQLLFYGAWICGVLGFLLSYVLVAIGGALLLVAAWLVLTRPDDPVNLMFDALPQQGILQGGVRRAFVAFVFGAIGVGWIVFGVSG